MGMDTKIWTSGYNIYSWDPGKGEKSLDGFDGDRKLITFKERMRKRKKQEIFEN